MKYTSEQIIKEVTKSNDYLLIELDNTIFYPGGGGQPCDTGTIESDSFKGDVVEVYIEQDKIIQRVKPKKGNIKQGDKIVIKINKERRTKLIQMHTGEHIFYKAIEMALKDSKLDKIHLGVEESSIFIKTDKLTWEDLFKAEELANKIIEEDRSLIEKQYTKQEAIDLGKLRIKPDRIKSDKVRVVEVKDFDYSACTGLHCESSGQVGNILITKFSFNKGSWEIRFKVNVKKELFELARITRQSASLLETDVDNVLGSINKIQKETDNYKQKFRQVSSKFLDYYKEEKIKEITLIYNTVENLEKKQLIDKAALLIKNKTIVCFVNKLEGKAMVLMNTSKEFNAPKLLKKAISKFNGKGGGRDNFAMGSVELKYSNNIIDELKQILN